MNNAPEPPARRVPDLAPPIDLRADVVSLTASLVDIPSESGNEGTICDAVTQALSAVGHLQVDRLGNTVRAATSLGRPQRVIIGGHLDTVPAAGNIPHRREGDRLIGLGSADMKGGVAVALRLAASLRSPRADLTFMFYDCEEVEASRNGLGRVARERPEWLAGDLAILMEPSEARVEAGCQGTIRAELRVRGTRAHSARGWLGNNAIHRTAELLETLTRYRAREVEIDGLTYREGLNAVAIAGGVAGNVIPDECVVTVNYRFAPDLSPAQAAEHLRQVFPDVELAVVDSAPGARPGLHLDLAREFVAATGECAAPKFGWTDVARFAAIGIPALNFGPGSPSVAHTPGEFVDVSELRRCEEVLRAWLAGGNG